MQPITILKPLKNNTVVYNFDFYPDQNISDYRNAIASDVLITDEKLTDYIMHAIAIINQDLKELEQKAEHLKDLTTKQINKVNAYEYYYKQALINFTHHLILEDFASYDLIDEKNKNNYSLEKSDRLKARARTFVKFLLQKNRATIELL